MKRALRVRLFFQKLNDDELNKFAGLLNQEDIMRLTQGDYGFLLKMMITRAPRLLPMAKKFLV